MTPSEVVIRSVSAAAVRPLRQAILRPHQSVDELIYPGDLESESRHFAAFRGEEMVGIASLYHQSAPHDNPLDGWRLRGMATVDAVRGEGIGGQLLAHCEMHARRHGGQLVWCNARTSALWFYEHFGYMKRGAEFDIAGIGGHYVVIKEIAAIDPA